MKTLINTELGFSYPVTDETVASDLVNVIKAETGKRVGAIVLTKILKGTIESSNGFELVDTDGAEETKAPEVEGELIKAGDDTVVEPETEVVEPEVTPEPVVEPELVAGEVVTGDADVVEPEVVKDEVVTPEASEETSAEEVGGSLAADLVAGKIAGNTSKDMSETRRRTSYDRQDLVDKFKKGDDHKLLDDMLALGDLELVYIHPQLKKLKFAVTSLVPEGETASNKHMHIHVVINGKGYACNVMQGNTRLTGRLRWEGDFIKGVKSTLKDVKAGKIKA
ncbi:hypothetical protein [Vibrio phage YC]|uniref:Uncharacterized protein n=1 Tax=Vibrio phage YC TaxID=2267403 RepID=A0A384ZRW7_9CAUD|nr:hypothetical protein HWB64_gp013 [Vibrio phage YC]AXC34382.1 hypothetical protein [Vibrio phage YC]